MMLWSLVVDAATLRMLLRRVQLLLMTVVFCCGRFASAECMG